MKIVIFAGGTGSIALQRGLYDMLDRTIDGLDTKVIVNAYDNGLSTGAVRQVMDGKILGPSDVRKNQTTRLELENPSSPWIKFLNIRFTQESSKAKNFCLSKVSELFEELKKTPLYCDCFGIIYDAVKTFFEVPVASRIDYNDFSLANIVYAGLARMNGNSLRKAASIMANALNIKDNVLLNDDRSLFLGAITKSGKRVTDEGDIVSWNDPNDPFVNIFFTDPSGNENSPLLCKEAEDAITAADLIILSSGTQWSSLIPTYASRGFTLAVQQSKAKIIMVMNKQPDKDSPSQTASDIIHAVARFFPSGRLHVIADTFSHEQMKTLDGTVEHKVDDFSVVALSNQISEQTKHASFLLAQAIGNAYFSGYLDSDYYMFDYDDTLIGRGNNLLKSSTFNARAISSLNVNTKVGICTGNTVKAINLRGYASGTNETTFMPTYSPITVYADGGVNKYSYDTTPLDEDNVVAHKFIECVNPKVLMIQENDGLWCSAPNIIDQLIKAGISASKIDNRGNAVIAIKPIDQEYRSIVASLAKYIVKRSGLDVRLSGRTTIEICNPGLSKVFAVEHVLETEKPSCVTYVGDEFDTGNDKAIKELAAGWRTGPKSDSVVRCLHVKSPTQTAFFLLTLLAKKNVRV